MRVILLTLSVATLSSTVFAKTKVITKKKIKIKGKPFTSYNAAEGDCYLSDKDLYLQMVFMSCEEVASLLSVRCIVSRRVVNMARLVKAQ